MIARTGIAGTLESSDITVRIEPNEGKGLEIHLQSTVENQFGKQIRDLIKKKLAELGVVDAVVYANDKGALDCTIAARVITAVNRASDKISLPWEVEECRD